MHTIHTHAHCVSSTLLASSRHSLLEDSLAGSAFNRLPGSAQGTRQLHQDSGERHDPCRDDPEGEEKCIHFV